MKEITKEKAVEHIGIGIAKIVGNYSEYALLINACDVSANRYENKTDSTHLSTTQNIPVQLRLDNEIEVTYSNENLVKAYKNKVLTRVLENYIIASVSLVDGILEDLYEILLTSEQPELSESEIDKKVNSSWRNDTLLKYLTNVDGLDLKEPNGFKMMYREAFIRYYELRIIRHAIVHSSGKITDKDYARLESYENETANERKHMTIIKSPLINADKEIILSINHILSVRKYLDRLLMYFFTSLNQKETE
jgi:hypothetical protein